MDGVCEPRQKTIPPEHDERSLVVTNQHVREHTSQVIGGPSIGQNVVEPAFESIGPIIPLKSPDLLERRNRAGRREPGPPKHEQIVDTQGRFDALLLPQPFDDRIDTGGCGGRPPTAIRGPCGMGGRQDGVTGRKHHQPRHPQDDARRKHSSHDVIHGHS